MSDDPCAPRRPRREDAREPMLPLTATIDHRYVDGWHISQLLKPFRAYLERPQDYEPGF